jgi:glycosyltransferase involved in cell wall biosynthesis
MVENGTNGFLVPQKNASQLAERIETLIEDKNLRVEFGQKSQEKFKKFYTESVFESNLVQILEKICNF